MEGLSQQRKAILISYVLSFLLISIVILFTTYSDALFLAVYPKQWLTYYFFAKPILIIITFFLLSPFLSKASLKQSFWFVIFSIAVLIATHLFSLSQIYIIPFVLVLLLSVVSKLVNTIGWNLIAGALDVRIFKEYIFKFSIMGSLGAIISAAIIPLIIYISSSVGVFYTALGATAIIALCLLNLTQQPIISASTHSEVITTQLSKQSFFRYLFLFNIAYLIVDEFCGYSYKVALLGQFSLDKLTTFIGLLNGSISLAALIVQAFGPKILVLIGFSGMLTILPAVCFVFGFGLAVSPQFYMLIGFYWIYCILEICFMSPGMEMIINPYPSAIRNQASFYLKGYGSSIGGLLAALLIYIINDYLQLYALGLMIVVVSFFWVVLSRKISWGYQKTLHEAIKENRFNANFLTLTPETIMFMRPEILNALHSEDAHNIRIGLGFFEQSRIAETFNDHKMKQQICEKINHPNPDIRYKAVLAIKKMHAADCVESILRQLESENNLDVGWKMVDTLVTLQSLPSTDKTQHLQSREFEPVKALGLLISPNEEELQRLQSGNVQEKLLLATLLQYLPTSNKHTLRLLQLITDESVEVSIKAIKAIRWHADPQFIPILLQLLPDQQKGYYAEKSLQLFAEQIFPQLLSMSEREPRRQMFAKIRLLTKNLQPEALEKVMALSKTSSLVTRLFISREVLYNARNITISLKDAIISMLEWTSHEIARLLKFKTEEASVQAELQVQLSLNRSVFLNWFSILTDPMRVASVAPHIEQPNAHSPADVAKAYELLDSLSINAKVREMVSRISKSYSADLQIEQPLDLNPGVLLLVNHVFKYQEGKPMNKMDIISFLRRIKLFEEIPVESLVAIADVIQERDMASGEVIFKENDGPDFLYCIVSGEVHIKKGDMLLSNLKENDYFGELSLLDGMPRTSTAIAHSNGVLLYISKTEFMNVLNDLPEVMRAVVKQVITYLRQNLTRQGK